MTPERHKLSEFEKRELELTIALLEPLTQLTEKNSYHKSLEVETKGADPHGRVFISLTGAKALIAAGRAALNGEE